MAGEGSDGPRGRGEHALRRPRVCLDCRTRIRGGGGCPDRPKHRVVDLTKASERARMDDEVWGPDSRARQLRELARAGAGGGAAGSALDACSGCEGSGSVLEACGAGEGAAGVVLSVIAAIVVFIVAAVLVVALVALVKWLWRTIARALDRPKPQGALRAPPKVKGVRQGLGKVVGAAKSACPWRAEPCVAFALELHKKRVFGGGALLRDAYTEGFEVVLDDGRRVIIPQGMVRLASPLAPLRVDTEVLDPYLESLDPERVPASDRALFPWDVARGVALDPGARVEVVGELDAAPDPSGAEGAYRTSAAVYVPRGVPLLRLRSAADVDAAAPDGEGEAPARARIASFDPSNAPDDLEADPPSEPEADARGGHRR